LTQRQGRLAGPVVVLASSSPRRRELLSAIGLAFVVRPTAIDESVRDHEAPEEHVRRLALDKARAAGAAGELVLAADTVVVLDGLIYGKPADAEDAIRMLGRLQGREHQVLTGVALRAVGEDGERVAYGMAASAVRLRPLGAEEIAWYVATGEPADKAGAYALQGIGGLFVDAIQGSSSNVIGLPLGLVYELFSELGHDLRDFRREQESDPAVDTLPPP